MRDINRREVLYTVKKVFILAIILISIFLVSFINSDYTLDVEAASSSLSKDVPKNTHCTLCNMIVYQQNQKMGVFSAQAIKKNGKVVYYDDIGCLLYDEVKNKTTNRKYVRDYKTLKWVKAEDAIYVKTTLRSPMGFGYLYFAKKSEADKYIAKNKKSKIVKLSVIKKETIERYKGQFGSATTDKKTTISTNIAASSLQKDVPKNTDCAFCNMEVYQQKSPLGVFAAQAIKKNGKVVYYDDISCLLYDEVKNRETNKKYVRDYTSLKWISAEKAIYVKTSLVSPMDDGYIYFSTGAKAKKYVAAHSGTKVVPFKTVRTESIQRYQ